MTDHAPVPSPGPEPAPFEFAFAEAAAALTALDDLQSEIADVTVLHGDALAGLSDLNQGETIRRFRLRHASRMDRLADLSLDVIYAVEDLESLVARAHVAEQERAADHAAWVTRDTAYQVAQASDSPVG